MKVSVGAEVNENPELAKHIRDSLYCGVCVLEIEVILCVIV